MENQPILPAAPQQQLGHSTIPLTFARDLADIPPSEHKCYECCYGCLGCFFGTLRAYVPCLFCCFPNPFITVPQGQAGILSRFGKAYRVVDPGLYFVNQVTDKCNLVDVKITISDIPQQVVMTKDNVSMTIDSVIYFHIVDPFVAKYHVANVNRALIERTMTTLRDTIGMHTLQNIIENREAIAAEIKRIIDTTARSWGAVVESILIKDLHFSNELQDTLSSAAKQQRIGESKVILAKAEVQSARLMREASDILCSPAAMQIRYLDTLKDMAIHAAQKILFMPTDSSIDMVERKDVEKK
jgi:regulator of protease activity HflC (stomatin/prohibitin superfamily)